MSGVFAGPPLSLYTRKQKVMLRSLFQALLLNCWFGAKSHNSLTRINSRKKRMLLLEANTSIVTKVMNIGSVELHGSCAGLVLRTGQVLGDTFTKQSIPKLVEDFDADLSSSPPSHNPLKLDLFGTSKKQLLMDHKASIVKRSSVKDGAKKADEKKTRRKKKWKKPKDKPNRPLSAYNFFFAEMRITMLGEDAPTPEVEALKKRVHCKTHGKIGFAVMARTIGAKWKELEADKKKIYENKARKEKDRYLIELTSWKEAQKDKPLPVIERENMGLDAIATAAMASNPINPVDAASTFPTVARRCQNMNMSMNMNTGLNMMSHSIHGTKQSSDSMRLLLDSSIHRRNMSRLQAPPQADYIRTMQGRTIDQATLYGTSAARHQQHPYQLQQQHQQMRGQGEPPGGSSHGNYPSASEASANAILSHFRSGFPSSSPSASQSPAVAASKSYISPQSQSLFERERFQHFAAMRMLQQRYMASGMTSGGMPGAGGGSGMNGSMNGMNGLL